MHKPIFNARRNALIKARGDRSGKSNFLLDRAFEDVLDRIVIGDHATIGIVGRHRPEWRESLQSEGARVFVIDPEAIETGDAACLTDDRQLGDALGKCSLVLSFGLLDHCNDPRLAAFLLGQLLSPGGTLVGTVVGGESLTFLRGAMLEMDRSNGKAAARLHPLMDGQSVAGLLGDAGLDKTVVEVDRLTVRYRNLRHLVSDLRDMGCIRSLASPTIAVSPSSWRQTMANLDGVTVEERFDLINFTARKTDG